ncbi:MAG: type III pantothenate kinase [Muribaculaceae bacterium]|nr:type III pantothenate kinase [Muribaculaceae bacterium]
MAKYLTIDNGNTSAKAAVWVDGSPDREIIHGDVGVEDLERIAVEYGGGFDCCAWCSTADNNADLYLAANRLSDKMITIDVTTPMPIDFSSYTTPFTLGADRIAALAGAHSLHPGAELLVADCGTAITYDVLDADGRFLGGNIAPGIALRLEALYRFTSRLPHLGPSDDEVALWGTSTASAMQAGAFYGVVAELDYYRRQLSEDAIIVLTGGAAPYLLPHISFPVTVDRELVLTGLNYIIEYNENL